MMTFMEVNGQQRSNKVNNDLWLPSLEEPPKQFMTFMEVKGQQRQTVNDGLWLPNLMGLTVNSVVHHFGCGINQMKGIL